MAMPNPQIEAALAHFAAQPGTTPDQEAQLRTAIIADADKLVLFNQQAAAGQLKGFVLETPGGTPNLTGVYDKAAGIVTVPGASFQPSGTAAGNDLKAVVGLQAITVDFAHKTWQDSAGQTRTVSQDMVTNLQSTLNGSPVLATQIKDAVTQGHVQHFSLLGNGMAAGATYDGNTMQQDGTPKGINLPPVGLQAKTAANPQGRYDVRDMTFVLGHEVQHGFNDAAKDQATSKFLRDIKTQAQVQGQLHDYTDELRAYIQAGREDEAKAEIAGWNALLSREQQGNPSVTLNDMRQLPIDRQHDFVVLDSTSSPPQTVPRPGLAFNQDNSLSQTPANIAAMGQHYFDRPSRVHAQPTQRPVYLGEHKPSPTADYPNYYGTWALEQIVAAENRANVSRHGARPPIAIDMAGLRLREDLIEMEGLNLGANRTPRPYLDTSQAPAMPGHFHHTQDASMGHDHQHVPIAPSEAPPSQNKDRRPDLGQAQDEPKSLLDRLYEAAVNKDDKAMDTALLEYGQSPVGQQIQRDIAGEERLWLAEVRQAELQAQLAEQQRTARQMECSGPVMSM